MNGWLLSALTGLLGVALGYLVMYLLTPRFVWALIWEYEEAPELHLFPSEAGRTAFVDARTRECWRVHRAGQTYPGVNRARSLLWHDGKIERHTTAMIDLRKVVRE